MFCTMINRFLRRLVAQHAESGFMHVSECVCLLLCPTSRMQASKQCVQLEMRMRLDLEGGKKKVSRQCELGWNGGKARVSDMVGFCS